MFGIQSSKIESTYFIVFTANPLIQGNIDEFFTLTPSKDNFYSEVFRFDQKVYIFNFEERYKQSAQKLQELAERTHGKYRLVNDFKELKYNIQMLASNAFVTMQFHLQLKNCCEDDRKDLPNKTIFYFDLQQKIKKIQNPGMKHPPEPAHISNYEEKEFRVIQKEKWPLPLEDCQFTMINSKQPFLFYGSNNPKIIIDTKPFNFDATRCHAELLHLQDPVFIQKFVNKFIKPFGYTSNDCKTLGWKVYMKGETQNYPFAILKSIKNEQGHDLSAEQIEQAKSQDYSLMNLAPYFLALWVMPLNFEQFWPLIWNIDNYKGTNLKIQDPVQQVYEKTKWKLSFDRYLEKLPAYYNDYINSYLRYLKVSIQLPMTEKVYLSNNKLLNQVINEVRQIQYNIDITHEEMFLKNKQEHSQRKKEYSCCQHLITTQKPQDNKKVNNKFELICQRENLIGNTIWQLDQIEIESFDDIIIGQQPQNKRQKQEIKDNRLKNQVYNEKDHEVPIQKMGDLERVWRHKEKIRNPNLSDELNYDLTRPFFGNPFKAPGELASFSKDKKIEQFLIDESVYEFSDEQQKEGEANSTDENSTNNKSFFEVIKNDQQIKRSKNTQRKQEQKEYKKIQNDFDNQQNKNKKRSDKNKQKNNQFQLDVNKSHKIIQQLRYKQLKPDLEYTNIQLTNSKAEIDKIQEQLILSQFIEQNGDELILNLMNTAQDSISDPFNKQVQKRLLEDLEKIKDQLPQRQVTQICSEILNYIKSYGLDYYQSSEQKETNTNFVLDDIYSVITKNINK